MAKREEQASKQFHWYIKFCYELTNEQKQRLTQQGGKLWKNVSGFTCYYHGPSKNQPNFNGPVGGVPPRDWMWEVPQGKHPPEKWKEVKD